VGICDKCKEKVEGESNEWRKKEQPKTWIERY
jgi:hypothetical protein